MAFARTEMDSASADASRMTRRLAPSARFTCASRSASDSSTVARLRRSASACISIACLIPGGGRISRISYRRHSSPHADAASLMVATMARVEMVTLLERLVEGNFTDLAAHGRLSELRHGVDGILDAVGCLEGIDDFDVEDAVDGDGDVVFGDGGLIGGTMASSLRCQT